MAEPVRITFRPASGGEVDLTPYVSSLHPTYGPPAPQLPAPPECPCCAGKPIAGARLKMCDPCWQKCVRNMTCEHPGSTPPLPWGSGV